MPSSGLIRNKHKIVTLPSNIFPNISIATVLLAADLLVVIYFEGNTFLTIAMKLYTVKSSSKQHIKIVALDYQG